MVGREGPGLGGKVLRVTGAIWKQAGPPELLIQCLIVISIRSGTSNELNLHLIVDL